MAKALPHDQTALGAHYAPPALQTYAPLARHPDEIRPFQPERVKSLGARGEGIAGFTSRKEA
jgi:hypothetical protein